MSEKNTAQVITSFLPQYTKDKVFILSLVVAMAGGLWLSLQSSGYLLSYDVNTLMIMCVIFTLTSSNFISRAKPFNDQLSYSALAVVPIALRYVFNLPFFSSYASIGDVTTQITYTLQVCALWMLVAVAEESFRATMMNVFDSLYVFKGKKKTNTALKVIFCVVLWILFHFIQRPFDIFTYRYYIIWLFISGIVMTYTMLKGGLGSSVLIHFIVNLTA
ncbi:MAG: type II CAAX prenyl endopeptidase Rce1 family protein [archaeon]